MINSGLEAYLRAHRVERRDVGPYGGTYLTTETCLRLPVESIGRHARLADRDSLYISAEQILACPADDQITRD